MKTAVRGDILIADGAMARVTGLPAALNSLRESAFPVGATHASPAKGMAAMETRPYRVASMMPLCGGFFALFPEFAEQTGASNV